MDEAFVAVIMAIIGCIYTLLRAVDVLAVSFYFGRQEPQQASITSFNAVQLALCVWVRAC